MNITTIKLQKQTKERLDKLREHRRETYDDLLRKILYILSIVKIDPEKANRLLDRIDDLSKKLNKKESK